MIELPAYRADAICSKCGDADIATEYQPNSHRCSPLAACWVLRIQGHIHRHCRRCGNDWLEAPLDAKENPE